MHLALVYHNYGLIVLMLCLGRIAVVNSVFHIKRIGLTMRCLVSIKMVLMAGNPSHYIIILIVSLAICLAIIHFQWWVGNTIYIAVVSFQRYWRKARYILFTTPDHFLSGFSCFYTSRQASSNNAPFLNAESSICIYSYMFWFPLCRASYSYCIPF